MKTKFTIIILIILSLRAYANWESRVLPDFSKYFICDVKGGILYSEPNEKSKKLCTVPNETKVESTNMVLIRKSTKVLWHKVYWGNCSGWISEDQISLFQTFKKKPKNTEEIKKILTSGTFSESGGGIEFGLNLNGTGWGVYDHRAGGEAPKVTGIHWKGDNPFYVTIEISTPIGSDSFNSAKSYENSKETIVVEYDSSLNSFTTNKPGLTFEIKSN